MPAAFVGSWTSAQFNNNTGGTLAGRTSTAGNWVGITGSSGDTSATVTHSQSGTVQAATSPTWQDNGDNVDAVTIKYIENIVGGASHTITITTAAGTFSSLNATEYSGMLTSSTLDKTAVNGANTAISTVTSGTTTTTAQADELAIITGSMSTGGTASYTAGSGYTMRGQNSNGANSTSFLEDKILSATGTQSGTATKGTDTGNGWVCVIATFKATASSSTPVLAFPRRGAALAMFGGLGQKFVALQAGTPPPIFTSWSTKITAGAVTPASAAGANELGLLPGTVETVPVPVVARGAVPPPAPPIGTVEPGLLPNLVETVPLAYSVDGAAVTPPQPLGVLRLGLVPGMVETVPLAYLLEGAAPVPFNGYGANELGIFVAPAVTQVIMGYPADGVAVPTPTGGPGAIALGLQPGTPPTTVIWVPSPVGAAVVAPQPTGDATGGILGFAALPVPIALVASAVAPSGRTGTGLTGLGLYPPIVETVPAPIIATGTAAAGPPARGGSSLGLLPPVTPSVGSWVPILFGTARELIQGRGRIVLGLVVSTSPFVVDVLPYTASAGERFADRGPEAHFASVLELMVAYAVEPATGTAKEPS